MQKFCNCGKAQDIKRRDYGRECGSKHRPQVKGPSDRPFTLDTDFSQVSVE